MPLRCLFYFYRRTLLSAKRLGLGTIAVQGYSQALHELRMADKVTIYLPIYL